MGKLHGKLGLSAFYILTVINSGSQVSKALLVDTLLQE